jgi:hypothetical protein
MASQQDALQIVLEHFEVTRDSSLSPGAKAIVYLRLAEAYAWLIDPSQAHGGSNASPAG